MPEIIINGMKVQAEEGQTVLQAARGAGIYIPRLCDDEDMEPYGACRLCIVEIEGMRGLPTACTTRVSKGMVVQTDTEKVNQVRRITCELLIADHPAECLSCAGNQHCELQEVASYLGISGQRLRTMEREPIIDESNPFFVRDLRKCILCGRCTRACAEIRGDFAIEIAGRGYDSRIAPFGDRPMRESVCVSCGECVDRCPVNALSPKHEETHAPREVKSACPYCGCGCVLKLGVRRNRIVRVRGDKDNDISRGSLCVKGRFGLDYVSSPERLATPLIRRNGKLEPASWDEALNEVEQRLATIKQEHGSRALAGLSSAKCTNEENYVFQKMVRCALGTNSVDHCARLCHASTVAGLARAFGSGAMTNSIDELEHADCIFITGSNTTEAHPIIALRIKAAVARHGARLIVADPRRIDITRFAKLHMRQRSGTDVALFNGMMNVILEEGLADETFISERTEGFEEFRECVSQLSPEQAAAITGVPAQQIREAARLYATAKSSSIVYSMGITQHTTGTDNVLALANLAMLTGNIGRPSTGVNPLRGQNNVQGACDLGALPNVYPGYQKVDDPAMQQKFEKAWNVSLSPEVGLTIVEIMNAVSEGSVRGLYVMGENPVLSDPNSNHVREALEKIEFLCVQDLFLTETAQYADVVLPGVSFAEKDGTFTNTERRLQRVRKALAPRGDARDDWRIISDISTRLGYPMRFDSPSEIMDEIAAVTPIYGGISYDRLEKEVLRWPCTDARHPGTLYLHEGEFKRGKGKFHPTPFREAAELPDDEYPLLLTTGRQLYHFHTGTMTRKTPGLNEIAPPVPCEIHPTDAAELGVHHGESISVSSRRGTIRVTAQVTDRAPKGTVFIPFHFHEGAANVLTNDALDPIAKIPEFKVCAVKIERVAATASTP